jgi:hypothetical protein
LPFFRIRRNVFIVRFMVSRSDDDDSATDRVEEFATPYALPAGQDNLSSAAARF